MPPNKMLVREVKNFSVRWLKKQSSDSRRERKKNALSAKSEPVTKTSKIEKKVRLQNNRIREYLVSTKHLFSSVQKKHNQMTETYLMSKEDITSTSPVFEFYFTNYDNWLAHYKELRDNAMYTDNQRVVIQNEKQQFLASLNQKKEHHKKFTPVLHALLSSSSSSPSSPSPYSSSSSSSSGTAYITEPYRFAKVEKTSSEVLERLYCSFYFETLVSSTKPICVFPEIPTYTKENKKTTSSSDYCDNCDAELVIDEAMGQVTCPVCYIVKQGGEGLGYKQSFIEAQSSNRAPAQYDRRHHFREFIQRLEGAERTEIPERVIHSILYKCRMVKINPVEKPGLVTYTFVRITLRENGYAEFFENISQIISIVTRRQPVMFQDHQKERLQMIFNEIQNPFDKHKGKRKNFLSYSYVLYKSCELCEFFEFLPYLPLFKASKNLHSADIIWRKICDDLGYQFIPTQV